MSNPTPGHGGKVCPERGWWHDGWNGGATLQYCGERIHKHKSAWGISDRNGLAYWVIHCPACGVLLVPDPVERRKHNRRAPFSRRSVFGGVGRRGCFDRRHLSVKGKE